jgi:proton-dependent oligopeptide transporter, POT family
MTANTDAIARDTADASATLPKQIPYIIGNEACERFSFYGMRNILVPFLTGSVLLAYLPAADRESMSKEVFHSFVIGVYFFPLLGGWLSDRFFGKYNTIFWLSLLYCVGHACLAMFEDNRTGFYTGLFLIALGSGGIKPLVSSFVGDQFTQSNKHLAKIVYDAFYWTINFGSFFASLLMPLLLKNYGPAIAFGVPGILMFIATIIFWAGRAQYVNMPPLPPDPHSFMSVAKTALRGGAAGAGVGTYVAAFGGGRRPAGGRKNSASCLRSALRSGQCSCSVASVRHCSWNEREACIRTPRWTAFVPCCAS